MMIYLQKSRQSRKNPVWVALLTVFIFVAIIFIFQYFAPNAISRVAMNTGGPISATYVSIGKKFSFAQAFVHSRASLIAENNKLRNDIENNQAKLLRFDTLSREYDQLLLSYSRSPFAGSVLLGNVISKPPQSPYDVLIVDVGSENSVVIGSQVYGVGGLPIGRVQEVTKGTSKIVLFSSVGEETQVVDERTGSTITVVGTGGGNLETQVAQDLDISIGDNVTLPQFGGAVVASAVGVDSSVASSFKKILFRLPVNVFNIRWVEIRQSEQG
jgi:cell shape-determining protein MreC